MKTTRYDERTPFLWDTLLLGHGHINVFGRCSFVVSQSVTRGDLQLCSETRRLRSLAGLMCSVAPQTPKSNVRSDAGRLGRPLIPSRSPMTIE